MRRCTGPVGGSTTTRGPCPPPRPCALASSKPRPMANIPAVAPAIVLINVLRCDIVFSVVSIYVICRKRAGQDLDGDVPPEVRVASAVDFAHAAGPDSGLDLIHTEATTRQHGRAGVPREGSSCARAA